MKVLITISEDRCIGIGNCELLAPEAVELGADGIARTTGLPLERDLAQKLCDECPSGAIEIAGDVEEGE